ncbi:TPA: 50S ribosomal protein L30 [Candidatus Micrarchaeota archaeon]|nr:50S ribosomal protein L30 [Candidatus Micrarchaeota archaeon]
MKIAVIRVRGLVNVNPKIRTTLNLLKLYKKNWLVFVDNTKEQLGMLKVVKDWTTYGEVDLETFKEVLKKRGKIVGDKPLTDEYVKEKLGMTIDEFAEKVYKGEMKLKDLPGLKTFFRLNPPRKGWERKGIKKPYSVGGALGYRGKNINELIKRML